MNTTKKTTRQLNTAISSKIDELKNLDFSKEESLQKSLVIKEELSELRNERTNSQKFLKNQKSSFSESEKSNIFGSVFRQLVGVETSEKRAVISAGSALIQNPNVVDDVVFSLQSSNFLQGAGVRFLNIENNRQVPKVTAYPAAEWLSEGDQITPSDPVIGSIDWDLKDIAVLVKVQNNVLYDATVDTEKLINEVAMRSINDAVLKAMLYGTGTGAEPKGIDNYSGVQTVSMGTDGAALTDYTKHTAAVRKLLDANIDIDKISFVQNPAVAEAVANLQINTGDYQKPPALFQNSQVFTTTAVKSDYVQGATSDTTRLYCADFSKLVVGVGGEIMVKLSERYADYLQTAFVVHMRLDPQPLFEDAFCIIEGITT